jgi:F-type H+-transporting ATPase subunit epsilon
MPHTFQLNIVLPEVPLPPREVTAINVPATDGRMTILANHQPQITSLADGEMTVMDASGSHEQWTISAGALQIENNVVTLLVREATLTK